MELGTTLGIGLTGNVLIHLDNRLPAGPWSADLMLVSGTVERKVSAEITLPEQGMGAPVKPDAAGWMSPWWLGLFSGVLLALPLLWALIRTRSKPVGTRDRP